MNYRLTFLKDTVMARYIDEICLKTINQLITRNNKEICSAIFYDGRGYMTPKEIKSIKDQIVEKIKQRDDMLLRFQAIEFMIELCQVLKSLQFSPLMGGGQAPSFVYQSNRFNSMQMIEQLNQANLIGLLAESLSMMTPDEHTLKAHLDGETE